MLRMFLMVSRTFTFSSLPILVFISHGNLSRNIDLIFASLSPFVHFIFYFLFFLVGEGGKCVMHRNAEGAGCGTASRPCERARVLFETFAFSPTDENPSP